MIKVKVVTKSTYVIELPIESFDDIHINNMPISESDEMIFEKLGEISIYPDTIVGVDKYK